MRVRVDVYVDVGIATAMAVCVLFVFCMSRGDAGLLQKKWILRPVGGRRVVFPSGAPALDTRTLMGGAITLVSQHALPGARVRRRGRRAIRLTVDAPLSSAGHPRLTVVR